ncbi:MAG: hypothetical protein ACRD2Z_13085 [Thermoanaerobaculia bacterium]
MARTVDEVVLAYGAALELQALYNAYRVTSQAHLTILRQIAAAVDADLQLDGGTRRQLAARLLRRSALAKELDLVFGIRAEDLQLRVDALREGWPTP